MGARRAVIAFVGAGALLALLLTARQGMTLTGVQGSTHREQANTMETQLARWRSQRDARLGQERLRFRDELTDVQARLQTEEAAARAELERAERDAAAAAQAAADAERAAQAQAAADNKENAQAQAADAAALAAFHQLRAKQQETTAARKAAADAALQQLQAKQQEELRQVEIKHQQIDVEIDEQMTFQMAHAIHEEAVTDATVADRLRARKNVRQARAEDLLKWFCHLPKARRAGTIRSFAGGHATCLQGSEGVPTPALPAATQDSNYMVFTKFDSAVISRSIAALASIHISNATRKRLGNAAAGGVGGGGDVGGGGSGADAAGGGVGGVDGTTADGQGFLPASDVYRGASVMLHPWLGVFYRVRVPAVLPTEPTPGTGASVDAHAYREECFRRPWAFLSEDGHGVLRPPEGVGAGAGAGDSSASGSHLRGGGDGAFVPAVRAVLLMHPQVHTETVRALVQSVQALATAEPTAAAALIVVLCAAEGCATRADLQAENTGTPVRVLDAPPAANDKWLAWRAGLVVALEDVPDDPAGAEGAETPIMLLDGHTSSLPKELVALVRMHVTGRRRAVLPLSRYMSPNQRWKEIFFDNARKKAAAAQGGGEGVAAKAKAAAVPPAPKEDDAYTSRMVMPIAFTKADGVAALAAWPQAASSSSLPPPLLTQQVSGGGVAACGRVTLAWILQSRLGMELRRYFVDSPELHGWDREDAEQRAGDRAKALVAEAEKAHNEYLARVKGGQGSEGSEQEELHQQYQTASFFPNGMSPTMVSPEQPAPGSQFCDLAQDALGLCATCDSDIRALATADVTEHGSKMMACSTLLGADDAAAAAAAAAMGTGSGTAVAAEQQVPMFRTFNPLHGIVQETESPPAKYVWSLGEPDMYLS